MSNQLLNKNMMSLIRLIYGAKVPPKAECISSDSASPDYICLPSPYFITFSGSAGLSLVRYLLSIKVEGKSLFGLVGFPGYSRARYLVSSLIICDPMDYVRQFLCAWKIDRVSGRLILRRHNEEVIVEIGEGISQVLKAIPVPEMGFVVVENTTRINHTSYKPIGKLVFDENGKYVTYARPEAIACLKEPFGLISGIIEKSDMIYLEKYLDAYHFFAEHVGSLITRIFAKDTDESNPQILVCSCTVPVKMIVTNCFCNIYSWEALYRIRNRWDVFLQFAIVENDSNVIYCSGYEIEKFGMLCGLFGKWMKVQRPRLVESDDLHVDFLVQLSRHWGKVGSLYEYVPDFKIF